MTESRRRTGETEAFLYCIYMPAIDRSLADCRQKIRQQYSERASEVYYMMKPTVASVVSMQDRDIDPSVNGEWLLIFCLLQ